MNATHHNNIISQLAINLPLPQYHGRCRAGELNHYSAPTLDDARSWGCDRNYAGLYVNFFRDWLAILGDDNATPSPREAKKNINILIGYFEGLKNN